MFRSIKYGMPPCAVALARKTKGNESEKQFNLSANFSAQCIWCHCWLASWIYEKWTVEHEHRRFHTSAQPTLVISSISRLFSGQPILQKFERHNKCNSWRFDSLLLFSKRSHVKQHHFSLLLLSKSIKTNWKKNVLVHERKRTPKINSFRNCERIGWLEASKQPASVSTEHQAMVNRPTVEMISNNHKFLPAFFALHPQISEEKITRKLTL